MVFNDSKRKANGNDTYSHAFLNIIMKVLQFSVQFTMVILIMLYAILIFSDIGSSIQGTMRQSMVLHVKNNYLLIIALFG